MFPVNHKPDILLNIDHTITILDSIIPIEICDMCIKETTTQQLHRGKNKTQLWKAQFDTMLLTDTNHVIYEHLNKFWVEYVNKTSIKINFIEYYEIKKYNIGDFFEPHRDNYFVLDEKIDRKLNLIVQLSDGNDYKGGDLIIGSEWMIRNKGSLIIFPAMYIHQITEITEGTRYSLIGHAWGPNWI